eukprot:1974423-Pleurochrysis_carterae.AAC.1
MPSTAILYAQRSTEAVVTASDTCQAIFTCPEPVAARAATSPFKCTNCASRAAVHHPMSKRHEAMMAFLNYRS